MYIIFARECIKGRACKKVLKKIDADDVRPFEEIYSPRINYVCVRFCIYGVLII